MKSHIIQKPVAVILGNAGNIGYLAAKAFACRGTVVAMLHEAGEESSRVVDCLPGGNHFGMSAVWAILRIWLPSQGWYIPSMDESII